MTSMIRPIAAHRAPQPRRSAVPSRPAVFGVDHDRIARAVREILLAVGEDPDREGLLDTPARVARAYAETFAGLREDAGTHLARTFDHEASGDDVVMLRNIEFASLCEHHLAPFLGRAHVAYLPSGGKVTGLSKLARTVDVFARRPQLQERLTAQIADALVEHLQPRGVAVLIEGEHLCMRVRGARKADAKMVTTAMRGVYTEDRELRREVLALLRGAGE
jgi:GTP cyclohydrolase IA